MKITIELEGRIQIKKLEAKGSVSVKMEILPFCVERRVSMFKKDSHTLKEQTFGTNVLEFVLYIYTNKIPYDIIKHAFRWFVILTTG